MELREKVTIWNAKIEECDELLGDLEKVQPCPKRDALIESCLEFRRGVKDNLRAARIVTYQCDW